MEKEFIPYEQALALKELGYTEYSELYKDDKEELFDMRIPNDAPCILYQQAFRWFRENHKLFGQVNICTYFIYDMSNNDGFHTTLEMVKQYDKLCDNYEEAELECLKKLIQIVKEKL